MKRFNYKMILAALLIIFSVSAKAQMHLNDSFGKPLDIGKYTDVEGSPYLNENWLKGTVKLNDGSTYRDMDLKFDMVANELQFKNKNGEPLAFMDNVKEFTIKVPDHDLLFRDGFVGSKNTFYIVLADGTVQLLKELKKTIVESRAYGEATVKKSISDDVAYYIYKGGKFTTIKKSKKSVFAALGDKQPELEAYIKSENLDLSVDADLAKLVIHYNSM